MLPAQRETKVKSLFKAMQVLECFSASVPELGITQIANMLSINKSNVHNIVSTFLEMGYMEKTPNGKYCLGLRMLEYSFVLNEHLGYTRAIYDIIYDMSQHCGEIVFFGIPHKDKVLYLYVAHPISRLQFMPYREILGETAPLYCTGIGKAILSHLPQEEWAERISKDRIKYTENTICDFDLIIEELIKCRECGYAVDNESREIGLRCVGVPVFNMNNHLIGGISISTQVGNMNDEKLLANVSLLQEGVHRIKERLYK